MSQIYQHFRQDERHFIDQVIEWKELVLSQYTPKLTDFLDPREQEIVASVIGENLDVKVAFFGGIEETERKRACIYPDYYEPTNEDFNLTLFEISYASKFVTIEHRHVLGSLMGLGLKRAKFGDILFREESIQFICASEIADFISMNFQEIGRSKIHIKEKPLHEMIAHKEEVVEQITTVSSLRLDVVAAAIYNLSRQKIQPLIINEVVKVNWKVVDSVSFECREGDTLSVRGYGRSKLIRIEGKTKKDRFKIVIEKQK
ncbi:RNA-binding protein [Metabacillus sp. HB246100]|uniref:YlmH family RNA-binding protein n=1 Tax=Bacillus weihaiensis TaxID=1547283 RepID=UPI0023561CB8|nr:RNA-binding protein [Bacillus weihaiensis]